MVIELTAEQEAQLLEIAAGAEKSAEEIAHQILSSALAEEVKFTAAVQLGLDDIERGDVLEPEEVWASIEQILRR